MRAILASLVFCISASSPLLAEVIEEYDASAGKVVLEKVGGTDFELRVGDQVFPISASSVSIWRPGLEGFDEVFGDTFLIWEWGGGSFCHGFFSWLNANGDRAQLTDSFGRCTDAADNMRLEGSTVKFDQHGRSNEGIVTFVYDGVGVTEQIQGLSDFDIVENPYDPDAWVGESAYNYLRAPQNEKFLLEMMSWEELAKVRSAPTVSGSSSLFSEDEGWIVGSGCAQSMCSDVGAVVAISRETAMPFIAFKSWDADWKFYGDVPERMPNSVRSFLSQY